MNLELNINQLLSSALQKSSDIYSQNLELTKISFSEKNIHDFRVCIRRFLAVNSLIYELTNNNICIDLKHKLKSQLKAFNPLRDVQVQFLKSYQLVYKLPVLYNYMHYLLYEEEKLIRSLKSFINDINPYEINKLGLEIISIVNESMTLKVHKLINLALIRFDKVINRHQLINPKDLRTIHKVRLAYKKFRYTMEIFRELLELNDEDFVKMKSLQTIMGNIQDNNVYLNNYIAFSEMKNLPQNEIENVRKFILEERKLLIEELISNFGIIYEFKKKLIIE